MRQSSSRYKWGLVGLLFGVGALNYGDRTAIASVFPLIRTELNMSDVELAAIGSVFLWAYALASPLTGMIADRFSRARTIVWSLAAWSLITLVTGFITSTQQLLFTRVLLGFSEAAYLPAAIGIIADYHTSKTRATAIGLHTAGLTFGLVAGGAGAGYMGEHLGWRAGFFFLGIAGLLLAGVAHFYVRDTAPAEETTATPAESLSVLSGMAAIVRVPSYLIIIFEAMTNAVGTWIFLNWLPLYFKETYEMSLTAAGFAGTFMLQTAATLGVVFGGMFSDRYAGEQPRRRMLIQTCSYFIAAPFVLLFLYPRPELILLNLCIFVFSFFGKFGATNETPLICDLLAPKLRSTAVGLMNAANCTAGGIGIMLAGFLKSGMGLGGVFGGISGLTLVAAALTLIGYLYFLKRDLLRLAQHQGISAVVTAAEAR